MAVGTIVKYNGFEKNIGADAQRQWDDGSVGNIMFLLATVGYTPSAAHSTVADLGANYISSGDGAPINAGSPTIDNTSFAGSTYYSTLDANFGATVTITAKYLVAVMPVTAGTMASTAKLLFYVDLNTATTGSTVSSTAASFIVFRPTSGWLRST
jgi:hypothetical protein